MSLSLLVTTFVLVGASDTSNLAETVSRTRPSIDPQMEGAMSTATIIALLEFRRGGSCVGCRDGMEGEEAVGDDDEVTRED